MDKPPPPVKGVKISEQKVATQQQQNMMFKNVGMTDRVLRGVIGLAFIPAVVSRKITPCIIASLFIASGGMGYCPVYHVLHLNTLTKQNKDKKE